VSAMLQAALHYRSLGLSVLPLAGKAPHARLLRRTHGTRSTNRLVELGATEEQVDAWFSDPGVNVGVFCGAISGGLVVIDLDDCEFPLAGARLPLTPLVKTGRDEHRGYHLYYRATEDISTRLFPWGEVRARSPGYVVAPPSIHPDTGRPYAWPLPLQEAPLADFSLVRLPEEHPASANTSRRNQIRPTGDVLLGTPRTTGDKDKAGWLRSFDTDPDAVIAMGRVLGITAPLGTAFPCVLHPDRSPSAALHPSAETGEWLYRDFHAARHNAGEWLSLAQVRATLAGRVGKLSRSEHATWKLILLVEAGLLSPVTVPGTPLPMGTGALLKHVYERFLFLLGCRWQYEPGAPAPFTRDFAAALCGISIRDARDAIDELKRLGAIYIAATQPAGGARTLRLWLPRGIEHQDIDLKGEAA
jgi:Bifunctional DNA primase/polymerase, N-terminal